MPQLDTYTFPHQLNSVSFFLVTLHILLTLKIMPRIFSVLFIRRLLINRSNFAWNKALVLKLKNTAAELDIQIKVISVFETYFYVLLKEHVEDGYLGSEEMDLEKLSHSLLNERKYYAINELAFKKVL